MMKIIHHILISSTLKIQNELAALGVVVVDSGLAVFDVDESDEAWPALQNWIARRRAADFVSTEFSKEECAGARWLELQPAWHHGYPQPHEDDFGYREATYDLTAFREECGIGLKQKAPFQMKAEPRWGRNGILQLNWIFDEYFARPEIWAAVFKPQDIRCRPVMNTRGATLKTVVQLVTEEEVGVVTEGLARETCARCGRVKYRPVTRCPFPALTTEPSCVMVKTKEYFGSGARAYGEVVISQALARALAAKQVRGASVTPVAATGAQG